MSCLPLSLSVYAKAEVSGWRLCVITISPASASTVLLSDYSVDTHTQAQMHTHKVTQGFIFFPLQLLQVPTAPVDKIQIVCKLGHVCVRAWVCVCVLEAGRIYVCVMWGWGSMWETNSNSGFVREHIRWEALGCSVSPLKANSVQSCIITELYCRVYPQTTACLPKTHAHTQMKLNLNIFTEHF